jgi:hypothetical protein
MVLVAKFFALRDTLSAPKNATLKGEYFLLSF